MRQKTIHEQTNTASSGSRFATLSNASGAQVAGLKPSTKAKADVALSMQAAGGQLDTTPVEDPGTLLLHELEHSSVVQSASKPASLRSVEFNTDTSTGSPTTMRKPSTSGVSANSNDSTSTIVKDDLVNGKPVDLPPPLPPKDGPFEKKKSSVLTAPGVQVASGKGDLPEPPPAIPSGFTATIANGISSAMRFVLRDEHASSTNQETPISNVKHHALLADINTFDDRPHIKYDWTIGKRLKFSCTVYYAKQFDILRKRCGISDTFVHSLSQSKNWAAEGGKSKSNFWKTSDDRYIIKTLVNAWNVADL